MTQNIWEYFISVLPQIISKDNKKVSIIIAVIIAILAIRFINENDFFEAILIQYGTLGIALTAILPTIIFFYFIYGTQMGSGGRKISWFVYGVIMLSLWALKFSDLTKTANWIYGILVFGITLIIIFDKNVKAQLGFGDIKRFERENKDKRKRELKRELFELDEDYRDGIIETEEEYKSRGKKIWAKLKALSKEDN